MNVKAATIGTALVLGAVAFGITGCNDHAASPLPATPTTSDVVYKVSGTAKAVNLTMQSATGIVQQDNAAVPVRNRTGSEGLHYPMTRGAFAYVSAQNQGSTGTVTCSIEIDGVIVSSNTSSGAYSIASCQD